MLSASELARQEVERAFPLQSLIPVAAACRHLGIAYKTARNKISHGRFQLPVTKQGTRNYVPAVALASYLALKFEQAGISAPTPETTFPLPARRPGRPTKREQIEHRRDAGV